MKSSGMDSSARLEKRGSGLRVAVIVARFNGEVTERLLEGALTRLTMLGVEQTGVLVEHVPGAFELPLASKVAAQSGRFDAVVAIGCVIRGETDHYIYVCETAAHGLLRASLDTNIPVAFGVLTVDTERQALARAEIDLATNKGAEAADVAIDMVHRLRRLRG